VFASSHIHAYIHTYIHTYTYIHTCMHTYYTLTFFRVSIGSCVCILIYTYIHTYMHACIHTIPEVTSESARACSAYLRPPAYTHIEQQMFQSPILKCVCIYVCMYVYMSPQKKKIFQSQIHMWTRICEYVCVCARTYEYVEPQTVLIYIHAYLRSLSISKITAATYIHTYVRTYVHACPPAWPEHF
jgi:hypothetical protein